MPGFLHYVVLFSAYAVLWLRFKPRSALAGWSCKRPQKRKGRSFWLRPWNSPRTWPFCAVTFFYGLLDRMLFGACHEIFGNIAVQHRQFNCVSRSFRVLAVLLPLLAGQPAVAGSIVQQPSKPDPLLDGGPTAPCAAGAGYAAGADATGGSVTPADVSAAPVPVPDAIAIPLRQARQNGSSGRPDSAYVSIDGHKLAPLLNPAPCQASAR